MVTMTGRAPQLRVVFPLGGQQLLSYKNGGLGSERERDGVAGPSVHLDAAISSAQVKRGVRRLTGQLIDDSTFQPSGKSLQQSQG